MDSAALKSVTIGDHEYSNDTGIFTRHDEAAHCFTDNVNVGMVGAMCCCLRHLVAGRAHCLVTLVYEPDVVRFYTLRTAIAQSWPLNDHREGAAFSILSNK